LCHPASSIFEHFFSDPKPSARKYIVSMVSFLVGMLYIHQCKWRFVSSIVYDLFGSSAVSFSAFVG
jgi:hypothetical protein